MKINNEIKEYFILFFFLEILAAPTAATLTSTVTHQSAKQPKKRCYSLALPRRSDLPAQVPLLPKPAPRAQIACLPVRRPLSDESNELTNEPDTVQGKIEILKRFLELPEQFIEQLDYPQEPSEDRYDPYECLEIDAVVVLYGHLEAPPPSPDPELYLDVPVALPHVEHHLSIDKVSAHCAQRAEIAETNRSMKRKMAAIRKNDPGVYSESPCLLLQNEEDEEDKENDPQTEADLKRKQAQKKHR